MLPAIPSILDLHFDSSIRRHPQTKLRARTRATLRLARVCPRAVIQPVVSTFAVVKRVWKSHLVLYLRETGNRLCPRVNTDAKKTPHPPKFSKTSTINETEIGCGPIEFDGAGAVFSPRSFSLSTITLTPDNPKPIIGKSPAEKFKTSERIPKESSDKEPGQATPTVEKRSLVTSFARSSLPVLSLS